MEELSPAAFRARAQSHGLELNDEEIGRMIPLVRNALALIQSVRDVIGRDVEPVVPNSLP